MNPPKRQTLLPVIATGFLLAPTLLLASTYKHIAIDGSFSDWAGVPVAHVDPQDQTEITDYKSIYVAHDNDFLYIRFTLHKPSDPTTFLHNIFIDTDNNTATGYGGRVGSELLIQSGAGYDERKGSFNGGGASGLNFSISPQGVGTDFELRISRAATLDEDQALVFAGTTVNFVLEAETPNFVPTEFAPDTGGVNYEFTDAPPLAVGSTVLVNLSAAWRYDDSATDRGTTWLADDFDDASWPSGSAFFGYSPTPGAYPTSIATPLSQGKQTYYFRTHFTWGSDTTGLLLVASNYLSDGAIFYVNGQEVNRLRMPAGAATYVTRSTGSAPTAGAVEVLGFNASSLVVGDNVLEVELHTSPATPAEVVLGLSLTATDTLPVIVTDLTLPGDQQVTEGDSATFTASAIGSGTLTYQWIKDGVEIPGATEASYTLPVVANTDAGLYSVRIGNTAGPSRTPRAARLTPVYVAVNIADATLPKNATVNEGSSVTFSSSFTGSGPLTYQWLKQGAVIPDATNATLTIAITTVGDAGGYSVRANNRLGAPVSSRTATLTVRSDSKPPTLTKVSGSYTTVLVTFSEPVTQASAAIKENFALSGGVTVLSAERDATALNQVRLTTSAQTLFNRYTLTVNAVKDLFLNNIAANSTLTFLSTILVDGKTDDWATLTPLLEDEDDSSTSLDLASIWLTDDETYLYVRLSTHEAGVLVNSYNNIFIDADDTRSTGYPIRLGSEMLIQGGAGYQEKNKGFNEGEINGLDWLSAPEGPSSLYEFRISKNATYANDGKRVFESDKIALLFETETTGFATADTAPSAGWMSYTFQFPPPAQLKLSSPETGLQVEWVGSGTLQSADSVLGPWTDIADATSPFSIATDGARSFFRLVRNPAAPTAATTLN